MCGPDAWHIVAVLEKLFEVKMCDNQKPVVKVREYEKDDYETVCRLFYNGKGCQKWRLLYFS